MARRVLACRGLLKPWSGIGYRSCAPEYATSNDLLTGDGSRRHGGRWNPVGIASVYASLTPETAMAEALSHFRHYGLPIAGAMPRTFVAMDLVLCHLLDVTDGHIRRHLRVSQARLLADDWRTMRPGGAESLTQTLGRAVYEAGCEGMLVPSASMSAGTNIVLYPDNLESRSRVRIRGVNQLPGSRTL